MFNVVGCRSEAVSVEKEVDEVKEKGKGRQWQFLFELECNNVCHCIF